MTSDLQAALSERAALIWKNLQGLAGTASAEGRGFTRDEQCAVDALHEELDRIDRQLKKEAARVNERWAGQRPPGARGTYIGNASASCQEHGCQSVELAQMLGTTLGRTRELIQSLEGKKTMTTPMEPTRSLWCEQGDHAFSEKDPDMQVIAMQRKGPDGEKVTESRTTCGKCAAIVMNRIGQAQNATVPVELHGGE